MRPGVNLDEVIGWMEGFLKAFPSMSVKVLIDKFKEEIERNDIEHRIHLRRVYEGKQSVPNMRRLRFSTFTLYKPVQMPVQHAESKSAKGKRASRPTEN
jgi:hypothetical protein